MIIALDLDGTLISCAQRHCTVARYCLRSLCGPSARFDASRFWALKRGGASTETALISSSVEPKSAIRVATMWLDEIEKPQWLSLDLVLPGIFEALCSFREKAEKLVLLSARRDPASAKLQAIRLGLAPLFDDIHFVPPTFALQAKAAALNRLDVDLYIGDTELDQEVAFLAKRACAIVDTGMRSRDFLQRTIPFRIFGSLREIFDHELGH